MISNSGSFFFQLIYFFRPHSRDFFVPIFFYLISSLVENGDEKYDETGVRGGGLEKHSTSVREIFSHSSIQSDNGKAQSYLLVLRSWRSEFNYIARKLV